MEHLRSHPRVALGFVSHRHAAHYACMVVWSLVSAVDSIPAQAGYLQAATSSAERVLWPDPWPLGQWAVLDNDGAYFTVLEG